MSWSLQVQGRGDLRANEKIHSSIKLPPFPEEARDVPGAQRGVVSAQMEYFT
jgi:hypothetical protein